MSVKLATCACVLLLAACDPPLCGTYDFTLPETKAAFANQPELITQPHAGEWCSEKYGTQGRWDPQAVEILFGPMSSATSSASYSDLLLSVKLQPSLAVVGTPVSFDQMVGTALLGLGDRKSVV